MEMAIHTGLPSFNGSQITKLEVAVLCSTIPIGVTVLINTSPVTDDDCSDKDVGCGSRLDIRLPNVSLAVTFWSMTVVSADCWHSLSSMVSVETGQVGVTDKRVCTVP